MRNGLNNLRNKLSRRLRLVILVFGSIFIIIAITLRVFAIQDEPLNNSVYIPKSDLRLIKDKNTVGMFSPSLALSLQKGIVKLGTYPPSKVCSSCHIAIHSNWKLSLHSQAALDPMYLKIKDLLAFEEGETAVRLCAGCHAPIALMTGEVGLYSKESKTSQEGVSCSFCHTLHSVEGENARWVSDPGRIRPYPGGNYLSEEGIEAAAHLVMANPKQHKEDMMRPFYRSSEFCQGCHEMSLNGVKLQSTFSEWQKSSYAKEGINCQACHFTPGAGFTREKGWIVDHRPSERDPIYRHSLPGGALTVAKRDNRPELREALALSATRSGQRLAVKVKNVKGGHAIPTGVSDLRELWIEVTGKNAAGQEVFTSGHLDAAGHIKDGSQVFHIIFGDENGNKIVRHDIWRIRKVLKDDRIPADGERTINYALPANVENVKVRLLWRDAPADFQQIVVQGATQPAEVFEIAEWSDSP